MASFASELLNFNDYVTQTPVDDYLRTGLMLQERYNQGVDYIQDQIDSVVGLPVATEADKKYLNTLVGEMESQIKGVASADFSRMGIRQQVGAMAGKVAKDPIIQNSVLSSQRINTLKESIAELRRTKPELYSQANEKWINENFVNPFYEQGKTQAGLVYSGPTDAIPYTDYRKIINEELQKIEPSVQTVVAPNGELQFKVDKSSTVTPGRIQSVINSIIASKPDIQQQMQIDGYFAYKQFNPQTLFSHIKDTYDDQIGQYRKMDQQTRELMNASPNDANLVEAATQKIKFIKDTVAELANKRNRYLEYINKGEVDLVKQTVFNDAVRDGYVLKYAKDNHEIEYQTNDAQVKSQQLLLDKSKNWLEFIKAGVNPDTLQAIGTDDPLYQIHLRATARSKKDDDDDSGPTQTVAIPGESASAYTIEANNERIATLDNNVRSQEDNLRSLYFKKLGTNAPTDPAQREALFRKYLATQSNIYNNPDPSTPLDNEFAQYMDATMQDRVLKQTLTDATTKIANEAATAFPLGADVPQQTRFSKVRIYEPDGTIRVNDVVANKDVVEKALGINREIARLIDDKSDPSLGEFSYGYDPTSQDYTNAMAKYANDPNYKYILSLARSPQLSTFITSQRNQMSKRNQYIDDKFLGLGRTASFLGTPFTEDAKRKSEIKDIVASAASITPGSPDVNAAEVVPVDYYNNLEGKLVVRYHKNDKDPKIHEAIVESDVNVFGNPNPYFKIQQAIDLSPDKSTPRNNNAMSTKNGKLKYAISYNQLTGYQASILKDGYWFTLPTYSTTNGYNSAAPFKSIAEVVQKIELLSQYPGDVYQEAFKNTFSTGPTQQK